jgi:hypothetical protein
MRYNPIVNVTHHEGTKGGDTMATKTYTPGDLAKELGISPKVLRAYLRKEFPRKAEAKNTSWVITTAVAGKARKAFAKNKANSAKA